MASLYTPRDIHDLPITPDTLLGELEKNWHAYQHVHSARDIALLTMWLGRERSQEILQSRYGSVRLREPLDQSLEWKSLAFHMRRHGDRIDHPISQKGC